jgi:hypothetical protein
MLKDLGFLETRDKALTGILGCYNKMVGEVGTVEMGQRESRVSTALISRYTTSTVAVLLFANIAYRAHQIQENCMLTSPVLDKSH